MAALIVPILGIAMYLAVILLVTAIQSLRNGGVRLRWMLAWPALPAAAYVLTNANLGAQYAVHGSVAAGAAMITACAYRPGRSQVRTDLLLGLKGWLAIGTVGGLLFLAQVFFDGCELNVACVLHHFWWLLPTLVASYGAARGVGAYAGLSAKRESELPRPSAMAAVDPG